MVGKVVRFVRYPLLFVLLFFIFLFATFPIDRFAPMVERQFSEGLGRKVTIGELSLSPFSGDLILSSVEIEVKAPGAKRGDDKAGPASDEKGEAGDQTKTKKAPRPLTYLIDEITVDVSYITLLFGSLDVEVDLDLFGGELHLAYDGPLEAPKPAGRLSPGAGKAGAEDAADSGSSMSIEIQATDMTLRQIYDLRGAVPVPLAGDFNFAAELESQSGRLGDLTGNLALDLERLVVGKAGSQIDVGGLPLTLDPVEIAALNVVFDVDQGKGEFSKFLVTSDDFDARIEGTVSLSDPVERSRFDLYLVFKILEGYSQKSATAKMLVSSMEQFSRPMQRAKRDDGYYGFRYRGSVRNLSGAKPTPAKTFRARRSGASPGRDRASRRRDGRRTANRRRSGTRRLERGQVEAEGQGGRPQAGAEPGRLGRPGANSGLGRPTRPGGGGRPTPAAMSGAGPRSRLAEQPSAPSREAEAEAEERVFEEATPEGEGGEEVGAEVEEGGEEGGDEGGEEGGEGEEEEVEE